MSPDKVKNALTAEEWADWINVGDESFIVERHGDFSHGVAAACLHERPFGFTREDVDLLGNVHSNHFGCDEKACWAVSLADRIESLLPPEDG